MLTSQDISLYGVCVPLLLNIATLAGYAVLGVILGAQALSATSTEGLSVNIGIVVIGILALILTVCGYNLIHWFDLFAWVPSLMALLGAVGCGGKHLRLQVDVNPASAAGLLSFVGIIAGFYIPWSAVASDFTIGFDRRSKT